MSTQKLYIFKMDCCRPRYYPLADLQLEPPVDWCSECGGELYRFDPVDWEEGPPVCPACAAAKKRKGRTLEKNDLAGII